MAEQDSDQERTEDPSEKRRKETKERGVIARSKDFNSLLVLLFSGISFLIFGSYIYHRLKKIFIDCLSWDMPIPVEGNSLLILVNGKLFSGLFVFLPFALLVLCASVIGNIAMGGWIFSLNAVAIKLERLNPIAGLGKIISLKSFVELVKSIIKILLVFASMALIAKIFFPKMFRVSMVDLTVGLRECFYIFIASFFILCTSLVVSSIFDVPYQIWEHLRQLKMTKQEVKDEYKEAEGKPEVKSRLRRLQRELASKRIATAVPTADVIITNPTHFAVALKYDKTTMSAPQLVAKGGDHMAMKIIELGQKHEIPTISIPPLARSIYHHTEIGEEVPEALYLAIAQVLAYVHQLKLYKKGKSKKPTLPKKFTIPPELIK